MLQLFSGESINDVYDGIVDIIYLEGIDKSPRGKPTKEIRPVVIELEKSYLDKFLFIPGRKLNYSFALAEAIWIISGRGDYEFIGFYNKNIKKYLDDTSTAIDMSNLTTTHNFHGAYGRRIRHSNYTENLNVLDYMKSTFNKISDTNKIQPLFFHPFNEIDQLEEVYKKFQEDIHTRQAVVNIWDPIKDNFLKAKDHPCNTEILFKVNEGKLDISVIRRSNDCIYGLPYNIVQFTSIQEYMAGWLGLPIGNYYEFIDSLHIYENEYPKLIKFFKDKNRSKAIKLSINELEYKLMSKSEMDRFLRYFFLSELEWRKVISFDSNSYNLELLIKKWIGELKHNCQNVYWQNVYLFLLAFHFNKYKQYDNLSTIVQHLTGTPFKFMAIENFDLEKNLVITLLNSIASEKEISSSVVSYYTK